MHLTQSAALCFLPFVAPVCLYVCFSDLRWMKIHNGSVYTLLAIFVVIGPFALSIDAYFWRYLTLCLAFAVMILLWMARIMGAGDAKFVITVAPMINWQDYRLLMILLCACTFAALITHKAARASPLRKVAPNWVSWAPGGKKFPMGTALAPLVVIYLSLGIFYGA